MAGVPMMPASNATVGPEDALAPGPKRGDYHNRLGENDYDPHNGTDPQRKYAEGTRSLVTANVAAGSDASTTIMTVTATGVVSRVVYVPADDITGVNTNTRKLALVNGGANGEGTTEIASVQFNAGTDAEAGVAVELTLTATVNNRNVAEGDLLLWKSTKVGNGIADPGGTAFVAITVSTS